MHFMATKRRKNPTAGDAPKASIEARYISSGQTDRFRDFLRLKYCLF